MWSAARVLVTNVLTLPLLKKCVKNLLFLLHMLLPLLKTVAFTFDSGDGGGIYNYNGELNIDSGTISGNSARRFGGGIFNDNSGKVTMSGGTVSDNTASDFGGGIYNTRGGTITMSGGIVSDNTAKLGGGIYCDFNDTGSITSPAKLKDNTATAKNGGDNLGGSLDKVTVDPNTNIYTVTFSVADGNGGSLSVSGETTSDSGEIEVVSGNTLIFTATPNQGWRVKEWTLDDTAVSGNTTTTYTTDAITKTGVIVTVEFEQITADMELSMTADETGYTFGNTMTYTVTVTNNDPDEAASDVTVTDNIPAAINTPEYSIGNGATWQTWNGSYNAGTLSSSGTVTTHIKQLKKKIKRINLSQSTSRFQQH